MEELIVTVLFFLVKINILKTEEFRLDINPVTPVYWVNNRDIFVNEKEKTYIYDVKNRDIVKQFEKKEIEVWGYENDKFLVCVCKNRNIQSKEEYSTHLKVNSRNGDNILDVELPPTVEIIECRSNPILKTVFPIEEKFFVFKDDLYEVKSFNQDRLSKWFNSMFVVDDLGNYWLTEFEINW